MSYLILDIENNSSETSKKYGRKAGSPLLGDQIVAIGLKSSEFKAPSTQYIFPNKVTSFKIDEDILVGHNISHDLQWFWHLDEVQEFFKRGGKLWDTALAHYIISGQQDKYPALREIAVKYYGCITRDKVMEPYWEKQILTSDIPKELVFHDVRQDVLDTEKVYLNQQIELAGNSGQFKLIELQMNALCATIEMTINGMKIDIARLMLNKELLQKQLEQKQQKLLDLIKPWWN